MNVAVASVKGSPGATTLAVGLAALWPAGQAVLVEADPHGGDLAARFGRGLHPGLASLAAAAHAGRPQPLRQHAQRLPLGVDAVVAPPGDAAGAAVAVLATHGRSPLAVADGGPVICDVGRLSRNSHAAALAQAADRLLLVARPDLDNQSHVAAWLDWLRHAPSGRVALVLTGDGAYTAGDVHLAWGLPVAAQLPTDRRAAGVLAGRLSAPGWRRLRLPRAMAVLAAAIAAEPAARPAGAPLPLTRPAAPAGFEAVGCR